MIHFNSLFLLSIFIFLVLLFTLLFAFTKSTEKISYWSILVIILFLILITSWFIKDMALQWVLIEGTTLIGSVLISMSNTQKGIEVAWKYLLLNSFGLGLSFLGLVILSFGIHSQITTDANEILSQISTHQNSLVETGIWLMLFGYSAKLGLFPNHFWVSDTYSESPSQISSIIAGFFPPTVCIAIRPLVKMDSEFTSTHFSSVNALFILGVLTLLYTIWTVYQTNDLRRITAQIALLHSGGLAILISFNPEDKIFYYALASNITIKSLLFSSMGVLRIDSGTRDLNSLNPETGINKLTAWLYIFSLGLASIIPFSPFFITDMLFLKLSYSMGKLWVIFIPILTLVFFLIVFKKVLPILELPNRKFQPEVEKILKIRLFFSFLLLFVTVVIGIYGIFYFNELGYFHV